MSPLKKRRASVIASAFSSLHNGAAQLIHLPQRPGNIWHINSRRKLKRVGVCRACREKYLNMPRRLAGDHAETVSAAVMTHHFSNSTSICSPRFSRRSRSANWSVMSVQSRSYYWPVNVQQQMVDHGGGGQRKREENKQRRAQSCSQTTRIMSDAHPTLNRNSRVTFI